MKKLFFFLPVLVFVISCGSNDDYDMITAEDSLRMVTEDQEVRNDELEAGINSFIEDFNKIQENLDYIKEKENIITEISHDPELSTNKKQQIVADIQAIYDAMHKNKLRIATMQKKLKSSNLTNDALQKMIDRLESGLNEKTIQITDMRMQLELLNVEMTDLKIAYHEEKLTSAAKTEQLNTAYYAFGTSKELMENGVLTKSGGFIGLGKIKQMKSDFNKDYFTEVDITKTDQIILSSKKASVVTTHPSSSYEIVGEKKHIESIRIIDVESFWSASKYLVIVVE